jgi:hypothetical protein
MRPPPVGRKNSIHRSFLLVGPVNDSWRVEDGGRRLQRDQEGGESDRGVAKPRADLIDENLCLRQR